MNQATTTKEALNEARQNLVPDKAPLEAAKMRYNKVLINLQIRQA